MMPVSDTVKVHRVRIRIEEYEHELTKDGPEKTPAIVAVVKDMLKGFKADISDE